METAVAITCGSALLLVCAIRTAHRIPLYSRHSLLPLRFCWSCAILCEPSDLDNRQNGSCFPRAKAAPLVVVSARKRGIITPVQTLNRTPEILIQFQEIRGEMKSSHLEDVLCGVCVDRTKARSLRLPRHEAESLSVHCDRWDAMALLY